VIRVFLVDDHDVVRFGFRELLELEAPDMTVVGEAATAAGAVHVIPTLDPPPDVAVLDIRLQDGTGIDVCRQLAKLTPSVACLIFTGSDPADELLYQAVMCGARGWMLKHAPMTEVVDAIRVVATGGSQLSPDATERVMYWLRNPADQQSQLDVLTAQEQRILRLIGRGLSNRDIGSTMNLSEKTVKNHVSRMFTKIGVSNRTQAAAWGHARSLAHRAAELIEDVLKSDNDDSTT
jgi:DNA-binding NarL/FixJ family response regulator